MRRGSGPLFPDTIFNAKSNKYLYSLLIGKVKGISLNRIMASIFLKDVQKNVCAVNK